MTRMTLTSFLFGSGQMVNIKVEKTKGKSCFNDFGHVEFEAFRNFMDYIGGRSFSS